MPHQRFITFSLALLLALLAPLTAHAGNLNADLLKATRESKTETLPALIAKVAGYCLPRDCSLGILA